MDIDIKGPKVSSIAWMTIASSIMLISGCVAVENETVQTEKCTLYEFPVKHHSLSVCLPTNGRFHGDPKTTRGTSSDGQLTVLFLQSFDFASDGVPEFSIRGLMVETDLQKPALESMEAYRLSMLEGYLKKGRLDILHEEIRRIGKRNWYHVVFSDKQDKAKIAGDVFYFSLDSKTTFALGGSYIGRIQKNRVILEDRLKTLLKVVESVEIHGTSEEPRAH